MSDVRWLGEARDGDDVALRVGRSGDELVAEWVGMGLLRVRSDGSAPRFDASPGADPVEVEKLQRGPVRLLLRHIEGKIGLHGAAVADQGCAALLVGASGDGKSTLAAALCARGAELLSDDAAAIDRTPSGWSVAPFEEAHWLDADSRASVGLPSANASGHQKTRVPARRVARAAALARSIVVLAFAPVERPRLVQLSGVDAVAALVPLVMRFVVDDPGLQRRELDALSDLVASVPIFRLERPRDLACLDAACDLVARTILP
jgi:hypothetical protein